VGEISAKKFLINNVGILPTLFIFVLRSHKGLAPLSMCMKIKGRGQNET